MSATVESTVLHRDSKTYALNDFGRLAVAQGASSFGDALLMVSLAGSIFFSQDIYKSRSQVLLYLLLTMAPFAVVAPIIGPALDRSKAGRRTLMAIGLFGRALTCYLMAGRLDTLFLYPLAFVALVLAKGHTVAKASLVPAVVKSDAALVDANSRLAFIGVVASTTGGVLGAGIIALVGSPWSLRFGAIMFLVGGILALRIPKAKVSTTPETQEEVGELHAPSIIFAGSAMTIMRGSVGFLAFFLAFHLRSSNEAEWFFGAVLAASALGGFVGVLLAPIARRRAREEVILSATLIAGSFMALIAARYPERFSTLLLVLVIALSAQCGRIAFDSLLQRDGPEHLRGRAFARFETRFQVAWVVGALIPVALLDLLTEREGYFALGLGLAFAAATYIGSLRTHGAWAGRGVRGERGDKATANEGASAETAPNMHDDQESRDDYEDDSRREPGTST
ncbi:MAG: hypothetical protein RLY23_1385 [Actinomycetota bacterium]